MTRRKNLARRTEGVSEAGSGVAAGSGGASGRPTGAAGSLGADDTVISTSGNVESTGSGDLDDLTILPADDPTLGLTNVEGVPPDDWAADTGPTRTGEGSRKGVSEELAEDEETPGGRKIDF